MLCRASGTLALPPKQGNKRLRPKFRTKPRNTFKSHSSTHFILFAKSVHKNKKWKTQSCGFFLPRDQGVNFFQETGLSVSLEVWANHLEPDQKTSNESDQTKWSESPSAFIATHQTGAFPAFFFQKESANAIISQRDSLIYFSAGLNIFISVPAIDRSLLPHPYPPVSRVRAQNGGGPTTTLALPPQLKKATWSYCDVSWAMVSAAAWWRIRCLAVGENQWLIKPMALLPPPHGFREQWKRWRENPSQPLKQPEKLPV